MFEDKNTSDGELFAASTDASATSDASTSDLAEESKEANELDVQPAKLTSEQVKQKTIAAWREKIDSGQATVDDLPESQQWVRKFLKATPKPMVDTAKLEELASSIVDKKMAEKEDERNFNLLKDKLNSIKLGEGAKKRVLAEYQELRTAGLTKGTSLSKAMAIAGIKEKDIGNEALFDSMKLPKPGYEAAPDESDFSPFNEDGSYDIAKGSSDQRMKFMESQRNPNRPTKAYARSRK